ncbi:MAG: molybdenum cofactor guanylyltransferase [Gemmataceae bacterium]
MARVGGVILCGGKSSRMGRPKAWLPAGSETMLQRVTRILGEVVGPIVVVAAPDQEIPTLPPEITIVRDPEEGRGPLQGLATGLQALTGLADAAYVSSCDAPFLRPAFVHRMIQLLENFAICVPEVEGFRHPLSGVYRVEVAGSAHKLLSENRSRPAFLFDAVPTRFADESLLRAVDPDLRSLRNVNTPQEYESVLAELTRSR